MTVDEARSITLVADFGSGGDRRIGAPAALGADDPECHVRWCRNHRGFGMVCGRKGPDVRPRVGGRSVAVSGLPVGLQPGCLAVNLRAEFSLRLGLFQGGAAGGSPDAETSAAVCQLVVRGVGR